MKKTFISTLAAAAAIGATLSAVPAHAGETSGTIAVKYTDLNLASPQGQATLDRRIQAASEKVCGYAELRTGTRVASADMKRCLAKATRSAKAQVAAANSGQRLGG